MSRIGNKPINIPAGVEVKIDANNVSVKGPKGELKRTIHPDMKINLDGAVLTVSRPSDNANHKALHGLTRALLNNMVVGVTEGFKKELEINGVGYRAQKQGKNLVMNLGYSHQVIIEEPEGIKIEVPNPNSVIVNGADKEAVGQLATVIREKRPPEPYRGKGIKYSTERIRRKEGKTGKK